MGDRDGDQLKRAKNILIGAVDTVLALASPKPTESPGPSGAVRNSGSASLDEHKRLFGFSDRKGKRSVGRKSKGRRKGPLVWKKECVCLRNSNQTWKPTSEEKIDLARVGLGFTEVVFHCDGDADHIHRAILETFPVLESCGGYTLMRLAENSHTMVEIEGPDSGMTVAYLKDVVNTAKLYIRPLQKDITDAEMKQFSDSAVDASEPQEFCHTCSILLPLSQLRKHITTCGKKDKRPGGGASSTEQSSDFQSSPPWDRSPPSSPEMPSLFLRKKRIGKMPLGSHEGRARKKICSDMKETIVAVEDRPTSPISPSPEPLSPLLEKRKCETTTYSCFVNLISDDEADWVQDPSVQQILQSSNKTISSSDSSITIEEAIKQHRQKVLCPSATDTMCITVRRSHIFEDALFALRSGLDERKHIKVRFLGEPGIDEGGPKREFFMLLLNAISNNSSLLDGSPTRRVLRHNTTAFQDELYRYVGEIIGLSIIHGGPGPVFLSPAVVDYLFGGIPSVTPSLCDIPDIHIQKKIKKLAESETLADFKSLLSTEEYDFRFACGVTKAISRIELPDKSKIIDALCLHYVILVSLAELEQLRRGLAIQKFNSLMESVPTVIRTAFEPPIQKISSGVIQDMYTAMFSPSGSNKRVIEESIVMSWVRYLQFVEGESEGPTISDVMVFLTGCDTIPPLGFGDADPVIMFSDSGVLPLFLHVA